MNMDYLQASVGCAYSMNYLLTIARLQQWGRLDRLFLRLVRTKSAGVPFADDEQLYEDLVIARQEVVWNSPGYLYTFFIRLQRTYPCMKHSPGIFHIFTVHA
jgi:hypothetical protein